jgi:hypothetical protein
MMDHTILIPFPLDAPTIIAVTGLVSVIGNIVLTFDARRRGIATATTVNNVLIPKVEELHKLTNGQSEKLNAVSKALGHAEGVAETEAKNAPSKT